MSEENEASVTETIAAAPPEKLSMPQDKTPPPAEKPLPAGLQFDDARSSADREALQENLHAQRDLGASATVVAPIGGQLISSVGGMVGFCPCGGNVAALGTPNQVPEFTGSNPPTPAQTNYLDCAMWKTKFIPFFDDVTQTSAWAQAMNITLLGGQFQVEVINDARFTPAMLAKYGLVNPALTGNVNFNLGCRMTLLHGNAANYPALGMEPGGPTVQPNFYYCPRVLLANPNTVIDAINKKMVRSLPLELVAGAPIFHMPYEASNLTAYLGHLANIYQGF